MKLLRAAVGLAIVAFLIYFVGVDRVMSRLELVPLWFVPFGIFYYTLCQLVSTKRWQILLRARGIETGFPRLFELYMIGMFANNFLPGAVGGDAVKAIGLYRDNQKSDVAIASVFLERFLGLAALGTLGLVASIPILVQQNTDLVVLLSTVGVAGLIALIGLFVWYPPLSNPIASWLKNNRFEKIGTFLHNLLVATQLYWSQKRALLSAFTLSVIIQAMIGLYYLFAALATGLVLPFEYFFAFLPAITLVSMIPISIGGLGVREATMIFLFAHVGVSNADILTISLIIHALNTLLSFAGGGLLMRGYLVSKLNPKLP